MDITLKDSIFLTIFKYKLSKSTPHRDSNIVVPTVWSLSKNNCYQIIHQRFFHVSISRIKGITRKVLVEGLPENITYLEEPYPIFLLTQSTKNPRYPTTDVLKFPARFMLQMYFTFFNVESIGGFTSTFVAICSNTLPHWVSIQKQMSTS